MAGEWDELNEEARQLVAEMRSTEPWEGVSRQQLDRAASYIERFLTATTRAEAVLLHAALSNVFGSAWDE